MFIVSRYVTSFTELMAFMDAWRPFLSPEYVFAVNPGTPQEEAIGPWCVEDDAAHQAAWAYVLVRT
jgi:hypothetical protein